MPDVSFDYDSIQRFPKEVVDSSENKIAEERRLFYVALTRARKTVDIFTVTNNKIQSRFLDEISNQSTQAKEYARNNGCHTLPALDKLSTDDIIDIGDVVVDVVAENNVRSIKQLGLLSNSKFNVSEPFIIWNEESAKKLSEGEEYNITNVAIYLYKLNDKKKLDLTNADIEGI
jgi:hypothetical protein